MIIDCIADLHGHYPELEGGDLLIVAGDLTAHDNMKEYLVFYEWLDEQEYKKKIVIAGNHDNELQNPAHEGNDGRFDPAVYLCDSGTEYEGLKIWGSPWTKTFEGMNPHCKAFTVDTEEELAEKFSMIPNDINILITHSPPYGILDEAVDYGRDRMESVGSKYLRDKFRGSCNLKLHVFGHIHENGSRLLQLGHLTKFVNASLVNERYEPVNKPIRVIL